MQALSTATTVLRVFHYPVFRCAMGTATYGMLIPRPKRFADVLDLANVSFVLFCRLWCLFFYFYFSHRHFIFVLSMSCLSLFCHRHFYLCVVKVTFILVLLPSFLSLFYHRHFHLCFIIVIFIFVLLTLFLSLFCHRHFYLCYVTVIFLCFVTVIVIFVLSLLFLFVLSSSFWILFCHRHSYPCFVTTIFIFALSPSFLSLFCHRHLYTCLLSSLIFVLSSFYFRVYMLSPFSFFICHRQSVCKRSFHFSPSVFKNLATAFCIFPLLSSLWRKSLVSFFSLSSVYELEMRVHIYSLFSCFNELGNKVRIFALSPSL